VTVYNHPDSETSLSWYGVYVFKINLEEGLALRGNVTHQENNTYYFITRVLYIKNVLYTISEKEIKMNDIETLELKNKIDLS
jgi:uncharacterized secreted protein with C-terminal beta-propeller domain